MLSESNFFEKRKIPVIFQSEESECGLACIAMVSTFFGHDVTLPELRAKFSASLKGLTIANIIDILDKIGFNSRALRLDLNELSLLQVPCILHWNINHFVVLKKVKNGVMHIHDPSIGLVKIPLKLASDKFTGIALEITKNFDFKRKEKSEPIQIKNILGKVTGLKRGFFHLLILAIFLEAVSLLSPMLTQWVTDEAVASGDYDLLVTLCIGILFFGITSTIIAAARAWTGLFISVNFSTQWMSNVMGHLLKLPISYFEKRHIGDVVSRFSSVHAIEHVI